MWELLKNYEVWYINNMCLILCHEARRMYFGFLTLSLVFIVHCSSRQVREDDAGSDTMSDGSSMDADEELDADQTEDADDEIDGDGIAPDEGPWGLETRPGRGISSLVFSRWIQGRSRCLRKI